MHRSLLFLVLILLLTACSDGIPPAGIAYTITSGRNEGSFLEQLTVHTDLTLTDGTLSFKPKKGVDNWLLKNQAFTAKDGDSFTIGDHHFITSFRVRLLANGDVLLSYQQRHHPPGMKSPELDTGSLLIPKAFVRTP